MRRLGNKLRRAAVFASLVTALAGAGTLVMAEPALAAVTVSGDVVCNQGTGPVVGVWIQAAAGSGWASGTSVFRKSGVTVPWTVHVGCGGTPSNWRYAVYGVKSIRSTFANWGCYPFGPPFQAPGCYTPAN
jgi:hypothetical protein